EEGIVDAGESRRQAPLDHDHRPGEIDVEDGHAGDGAGGVLASEGVDDVVRSHHEGDVGVGEVVVDVLQIEQEVVVDVRLRQQHVQVTRHAPCHGVDGVAHLDSSV